MSAASRHVPLIAAAIAEVSGTEARPLHGRWELAIGDRRLVAQLAGAWVVMILDVPCESPAIELLCWNAALPGRAKFALTTDGDVQLRAEIPLDEGEDVAALIRETWSGFDAACALLRGGELRAAAVEETAPAVSTDALKTLCEEAAWNFSPRSDGSLAVELECPGAFHQASLAAHRSGLRASVELAGCAESSAESAQATGVLLLAAGGAVRMARPAVEIREGKLVPRFEVDFSAVPKSAPFAHALSALSVACRLCAEEVKALQNPDVARESLALREWPDGRARSVSRNRKEQS